MLIKSVTILCLFALANAGTIHPQQRNIPVEIIYDEPRISVRNLNEKAQLTPKEFKEASSVLAKTPGEQDRQVSENNGAVRNLDEKVQLTPEELSQALKHLPVQGEGLAGKITEKRETANQLLQENVVVTPEPNPLNVQIILKQAEDIISSGLQNIRDTFKPDKNQQEPNPEQWEELEKAVNEYFIGEKNKLQLKQQQPQQPSQPDQNQNFFQTIANGFQTITNNFIQNLQGNQQNNNKPEDEQQPGGGNPGGFQNFINYFQGGVNNIVNAINNIGSQGPTTTNTVLGDPGTGTTQSPGFISNFVNNVQQFFGGIQGVNQGGAPSGTQGDTGVNTNGSRPQGPVQVIQTIGSAIGQIFQNNRPPNTSGDEGTNGTNVNIIQSIGQNIGSAIQNSPLNPFRPPKPAGEGGAASPTNPIQAGVETIGNQIQQVINQPAIIPAGSPNAPEKKPEDEVIEDQSNKIEDDKPSKKSVGVIGLKAEKPEDIKEVVSEDKIEEVKEIIKDDKQVIPEEKKKEKKEEIMTTAE